MTSAPAAPACRARAACRRGARRRRVSPTLPKEQGEALGKQGPVQGVTAAEETTAEETNQVRLTPVGFFWGERRGPEDPVKFTPRNYCRPDLGPNAAAQTQFLHR